MGYFKVLLIGILLYFAFPLLMIGGIQLMSLLMSNSREFQTDQVWSSSVENKQKFSLVRHVVVVCHGFAGSPAGLNNVRQTLHEVLDTSENMVYFSTSNWQNLLSTTDGVDAGGQRLANEVLELVQQLGQQQQQQQGELASLQEISFVGASLGGLYIRYAIAKLYDPETQLVAGLKPRVYVSLASPHLGAQMSWFDAMVFRSLSTVVALVMAGGTRYQRTLQQMNRRDDEQLLMRMAGDLEFVRAWAQFDRRVLFANRVNDNRGIYESMAVWPVWRHDPSSEQDQPEVSDVWTRRPDSQETREAFAEARRQLASDQPSRLDPDQLEMADRLRQALSFTVVDTHFDGMFAMALAHVHIQGRFVDVSRLCHSHMPFLGDWCDLPGSDTLSELGNLFKQ